ncbi:MAG: FecR domain-containing protein [Candidatus Lindowbacteria bacterium]|nr:FecR domain-containing protein [Candidatus Lindowbacteria bacterium]
MSEERALRGRLKDVLAALGLVLATMLVLPANALAEDAPNVARISTVVDDAFVLGKDDVEWGYAEPNLIIEEGDLLETNETGRAEVQFDTKLLLRIGERSRIAVIEMDEARVVGMDSGRLYLRVADRLSPNEALTLTFPSGQLLAGDKALVRVDMLDESRADVKVVRGSVEVLSTSGEHKLIRSGERILLSQDGKFEFTSFGPVQADDFDSWNEQRDIALSTYRRPSQLSENIVGQENLNGYGDWVYSNQYNQYAWQPYVAESWTPYYYGYWYYSSLYGWTWVPYEPWGYATYHYGSWVYDQYYGWLWAPGYTWRPAYVSWVTYGDYIGWVPLGVYGYPVITAYPYYVPTVYVSHVDVFSFTFIHRRHFHGHHVHHFHDHARLRDEHARLRGEHATLRREHETLRREHQTLRENYIDIRENRRNREPIDSITAADIRKIEEGKVRFQKDIRNIDVEKSLRKGALKPEKLDFREVLDVKKHPELKEKIAKIDTARTAGGKRAAAAISSDLPKKRDGDKVKALDFRKQVNARNSGLTASRAQATERGLNEKSKTELGTRNSQLGTQNMDSILQRAERIEKPDKPKKPEETRIVQPRFDNDKGKGGGERSVPPLMQREPGKLRVMEGASPRRDSIPPLPTGEAKKVKKDEFQKAKIEDKSLRPTAPARVEKPFDRVETPKNRETPKVKATSEREAKQGREISKADRANMMGRESIPPIPQGKPQLDRGSRKETGRKAMPTETGRNRPAPMLEQRKSRETQRPMMAQEPPRIQQPQRMQEPLRMQEAQRIREPQRVQEPQRMQMERPTTVDTRPPDRGWNSGGKSFGSRVEMRGGGGGNTERVGGFSSGRGGKGRR